MKKSFRDRFFFTRLTRDEHRITLAIFLIGILILILFGNSMYLTYLSLKSQNPVNAKQDNVGLPSPTSAPLPTVLVQPTAQPVYNAPEPQVKEIFIPFGSGTNQTSDWANVPGLTAQIDFGKYIGIKEVHFEATVGIPTQNQTASVQLFNVTDQHPVWYSPITLTDGQFVSSNPIVYDVGPKVYQVQMKTSLQFLANLYQARLHIILK